MMGDSSWGGGGGSPQLSQSQPLQPSSTGIAKSGVLSTPSLSTSSLTWHPFPTTGDNPTPRQGHSAGIVNDKLYIFGGLESHHRTNSLVALDLTTRVWERLVSTGELPSPRSFAAAWVFQSRLYIHGGETDDFTLAAPRTAPPETSSRERLGLVASDDDVRQGRICADDLWCFDSDVRKWCRVLTRLGPLPRRSHSVTVMTLEGAQQAVLFGGLQGGRKGASNEVYSLSLDNAFLSGRGLWVKINPTGAAPTPRYGHTCTQVGTQLFVHGGMTQSGDLLSDIYILDLTTTTWLHIPKFVGRAPPSRYGHQTCAMIASDAPARTGLLVFGGATRAGNNKNKATSSSCQHHRDKDNSLNNNHNNNTSSNQERTIYSHELYFYDCQQYRWLQVSTGHAFPNSRFGHSMSLVTGWRPPRFLADGRVAARVDNLHYALNERETTCKVFAFVFGGLNSMYCNADTWMLELQWKGRNASTAPAAEVPAPTMENGSNRRASCDILMDTPLGSCPSYVQVALSQARKENAIAQRELMREAQKRLDLQKKYEDLKMYCAGLQAQLADLQISSSATITQLEERLDREKKEKETIKELNHEAYQVLNLVELSSALRWGACGSHLLSQKPELEETLNQAESKAQELTSGWREQQEPSPLQQQPPELLDETVTETVTSQGKSENDDERVDVLAPVGAFPFTPQPFITDTGSSTPGYFRETEPLPALSFRILSEDCQSLETGREGEGVDILDFSM